MYPDGDINELLARFRGKSVLVIGDLILDHYIRGKVGRISPEAPVPVVTAGPECLDRFHPGGAANVARNIISLGGRATLLGLTGDDSNGKVLKNLLRENSIDCTGLIIDQGRPTTTKTRIMAKHQQIIRIDRENSAQAPPAIAEIVLEKADTLMKSTDVVIFEDYDKGCIFPSLIEHVVSTAENLGVETAVDPKFRNFACYKNCSLIKPNLIEASRFLNREIDTDSKKDILTAAEAIRNQLSATAILLTLGEKGSVLVSRDEEPGFFDSVAHHVYDVSGAGDTVISVLALGLASGIGLIDSAKLANFAAAAVCAEPGVYAVTAEDVTREAGFYLERKE